MISKPPALGNSINCQIQSIASEKDTCDVVISGALHPEIANRVLFSLPGMASALRLKSRTSKHAVFFLLYCISCIIEVSV